MTDEVILYRFRVRGGTADALTTVNEIPLARELVIETNTRRMKLGDGATAYNELAYVVSSNIIHTVAAPPSAALGMDGDYALRQTTTGPMLYGPKAGGAWPAGQSLKGDKGDKGDVGARGQEGTRGLSAYEVAVSQGFGGTPAEWVASLKGTKGDKGDAGPAGIPSQRRVLVISETNSGLVSLDWTAYDEIRITLTADTTLQFAGALDGQGCIIKLRQDAVGGRAVVLPASVRFNGLIPSYDNVATRDAGKADKVGFMYDAQDGRYDLVSVTPGI